VFRFQVDVVGGTGEHHDITVRVASRLQKASESPVVALGAAMNITTDCVDASQLAWITGNYRTITLTL